MNETRRFNLSILLILTFLPVVPAAAAQTQSTTRRSRAVRTQKPPRTSDTPGRSGDDVPAPPKTETGGNDQPHRPPRDEPPRPPRRPRRPPFGVVITLGGNDEPRRKDDQKVEKKKKDKGGDTAAGETRPLKYDGRTYRNLGDSLLRRNRVSAALRVLELLKAQEYYAYTGSFGDVATAETPMPAASRPTLASRLGADDYSDLVVHVKKKEKSAKKHDEGSWEDEFESSADALLTFERDAAALRVIPVAARSDKQQKELEKLEAEIDRAAADLDTMLDALSRDLGRKDPRVKNLATAERLSDALSRVPPGTVAIYTIAADERFWTVVVSAIGSTAYSTPIGAAALERKTRDFRAVLTNPKQDPRPLAREIYDVVLGGAKNDSTLATAHTLLWSFDGVLRYVPPAALYDGHEYLVERYRNVVFNRASIDTLFAASSGRLEGVGLGVARQIGTYRPLPAVADELDGIFRDGASGDTAGAVSGRVLLDTSFTEPALERALRDGNPVVHIATHFQLDPNEADRSVLLLGDGSLVNVGEISDIKGGFRGVELLTLSACDTAASGPTADGREVECFGTIAQERGARSVIASLWPVNDRSTSLLMQTFYRMQSGPQAGTKAEELRQAQLALIHGTVTAPATTAPSRILTHEEPPTVAGQPAFTPDPGAPFAHPYYWAPFVMIGSSR